MRRLPPFHFYPNRLLVFSLGIIALFGCCFFLGVFRREDPDLFNIPSRVEGKGEEVEDYRIRLSLNDALLLPSLPHVEEELFFSSLPLKPLGGKRKQAYFLGLKKTGEIKRVAPPFRIGLAFTEKGVAFDRDHTSFSLLLKKGKDRLLCTPFIKWEEEVKELASFSLPIEQPKLCFESSFAPNSPVQELLRAKWLKKDLLFPGKGERIALNSQKPIECKPMDWLVWKAGKWQKGSEPEKDAPSFQMVSAQGDRLELEGWGDFGYARIAIAAFLPPPFDLEAKRNDLLHAIRIRSEKQISCMLEKQCIVLKVSDWVLKTQGRWKVLRKKEDIEALRQEKISGEVFVLESIVQNGEQKIVKGRLFSEDRSRFVPIEAKASSRRSLKRGGKRL